MKKSAFADVLMFLVYFISLGLTYGLGGAAILILRAIYQHRAVLDRPSDILVLFDYLVIAAPTVFWSLRGVMNR